MKLTKFALAFAALAGTGIAAWGQTVYFEDEFDGDDLAMEWELLNPNPDTYLVEAGILTMLALDRAPVDYANADNVLRLSKPLPGGDWEITTRFLMEPATMGEEVSIGVAKDGENSLLAKFSLFTGDYVTTSAVLTATKLSRGEPTFFSRPLYQFGDRDVETRAGIFRNAVNAVELRLTKEGRQYTAALRLDATEESGIDTEWQTVQKLSSLRAPGDAFVLMFGSNSTSYMPGGGEGLVEIEWVRITAE